MLVVPFGRRDVLGVVVEVADESDVDEARLLEPRRSLELGLPVELVAGRALDRRRVLLDAGARACAALAPRSDAPARRPPPSRRATRRRRRRSAGCSRTPPSSRGEQRAALEPAPRRPRRAAPRSGPACAASPARARQRSTCRPRRPRWPRGAARSSWCPRSRSRRRSSRASSERFGDTVAVLHSRLKPSRALRRVAAPSRGQRACLRRTAFGGVRAAHATSG